MFTCLALCETESTRGGANNSMDATMLVQFCRARQFYLYSACRSQDSKTDTPNKAAADAVMLPGCPFIFAVHLLLHGM